ncbi:MAG: NFACT family protein, partial [Synergistaceae bacterium]|nr:NFACT family protein [Synergistaceae bacterium]
LANLTAIPPRAEKVLLPVSDPAGSPETRIEIGLDPGLSPSRNAERYFQKYKKARVDRKKAQKIQEEIASLRSGIEEMREQRDLLESIEDLAQLEEAVRDVAEWIGELSAPGRESDAHRLRSAPNARLAKHTENMKSAKNAKKTAKNLPPYLRFDLDGCVIFVGLSARGNRFVTFKLAAGNDLWFHAHELPGAHVILRASDPRVADPRVSDPRVADPRDSDSGLQGGSSEEGPARAVLFAASLAAAYSRGKTSLVVPVDYTERRHVRSVPGTVALVTYTDPRTLRVAPDYWKKVVD